MGAAQWVAFLLLTQRPRVWFLAFPRFVRNFLMLLRFIHSSALLRAWTVQKKCLIVDRTHLVLASSKLVLQTKPFTLSPIRCQDTKHLISNSVKIVEVVEHDCAESKQCSAGNISFSMDVLFAHKWVVNCCLQTTPFTPSQVSTGELWQQYQKKKKTWSWERRREKPWINRASFCCCLTGRL